MPRAREETVPEEGGGGFKHVVSTMLDSSAFLPGPAFHCYWERALSKLRAAGQAGLVEYLVERGGVGSLTLDEGAWTAKWQSSYDHVEPGYSTYAPNVIESYWRREDVLHGKKADREVASAMFQKTACTVRV